MVSGNSSNQERLQQLKAFDESKAGVKGIVDAGITKIQPIFVLPKEYLANEDRTYGKVTETQFSIPVVDLADTTCRRAEVINGVRQAPESVGFFQVVNHGIPKRVLEEMLEKGMVKWKETCPAFNLPENLTHLKSIRPWQKIEELEILGVDAS